MGVPEMIDSNFLAASSVLIAVYEDLDRLDRNLVNLLDEPGSHSALANVFRDLHVAGNGEQALALSDCAIVQGVQINLLTVMETIASLLAGLTVPGVTPGTTVSATAIAAREALDAFTASPFYMG